MKKSSYQYRKFRDQLIRHEGVRTFPYDDKTGRRVRASGKVTIGVGRNLEARPLAKDEVYYLLNNDIKDHIGEVDAHLPWVKGLSGPRQNVVYNMAFNLGIAGLLKFKNTLKAIRRGDWDRAAMGMKNSLWYRQVGRRSVELVRQMKTGRYQTG